MDPDAIDDLQASDPDFQIPKPKTVFFRDDSQSIISRNSSPDLGFDASLNPYRGCEHGCSYCYARPYHEYLGFSAGLDFESKIMVKENAPELLERELSSPNWKPQVLACSGVTDCYQPIERKLEITRRCLEVLARFGNPVTVVTKNGLVTRDIDHLSKLAKEQASAVAMSITTLDRKLASKLEPRASTPQIRLRAIEKLAAAGIPVGVSVAPIIPGLNDHEIPAILSAAAEAGANYASFVVLRLPYGVSDLFLDWLELHYPDRRDRIEGRIRELRGGKLNDSEFKTRMKGKGPVADEIRSLFQISAKRAGLNRDPLKLNIENFRSPLGVQLQLF
ncbi:MAG: PA0069 family radical SAM protein [Verrucomicrobiota bacterium]